KKIKIMDISKYDYIVLNLIDIDTQFKVYKKILEINGKISQGTNSVDKDEPYWFYETETNEFGKCGERLINKDSDLLCDTIADFFKKIKSLEPKKVITIGDYVGKIYKEYIEVGCQTIPKEQIEEILEIMNK
ncbi:MAG: hypothetical protein ACRC63_00770, partial [Metamycoplasmataceae bacterium]